MTDIVVDTTTKSSNSTKKNDDETSSNADAVDVDPSSTPTPAPTLSSSTSTSFNKFNFINLFAYIVNVFVTFAIGAFGLWGMATNTDLSKKYQTLATPFGTSFSIWGLVFIWQAFWVLWQFLPSQRNSEGVIKAWYYYPIMTVLQVGWTISFSFEIIWLSLIFMYGILATLIAASMSLQRYEKTWKGYLLWQGPFSVQTGWIMAASAVNTNVITVSYDATATTQIIVASLSLVVLLSTAFTWLSSYPCDFAIPLVILWALGGIYAELQDPIEKIRDEFTSKQINGVQSGVLAGLCLVAVGIISKILYIFLKQRPAAMMKKKQLLEEEGKASLSAAASASPESDEEAV